MPLRCFLALDPDPATLDALAALQGRLRGGRRTQPGVRWTAPAQQHLTLRFFGAASEAQARALGEALPALAIAAPTLAGCGLALWPHARQPRVLVLRLATPPALRHLAERAEALARAQGFGAERRAFRAHVTLARLGPQARPPAPDPEAALPACRFEALTLYASTLTAEGALYTVLQRAWLPVAAAGP
ncbi:RNA 2',3'-cyclic phosphodiesterase [Mizugakiibacter sediminis]|uniref:RNA 2',3'-cyclic phosphodiesterase n=1 Tax=Mizugakiibacter sediminis TaxID=1475481 RepID=UPI001650DD12|nr:RNA 2',3'-cyclic phosphodiesterase [Mizugakiibacter sediminis]